MMVSLLFLLKLLNAKVAMTIKIYIYNKLTQRMGLRKKERAGILKETGSLFEHLCAVPETFVLISYLLVAPRGEVR
jgi:hypothetical protein